MSILYSFSIDTNSGYDSGYMSGMGGGGTGGMNSNLGGGFGKSDSGNDVKVSDRSWLSSVIFHNFRHVCRSRETAT